MLPRELLYISDEVFFAGTAAEITPIRSVDKIQVGRGAADRSPTAIQQAVLRHHQRQGAGPPRLADVCVPGQPLAAVGPRRLESPVGSRSPVRRPALRPGA